MLTRCFYKNFVEKEKDDEDEENPKMVAEPYLESDEAHVSDFVEVFNRIFIPGMIIIVTCLFLVWVYGDGIGKLMYILF